MSRGNLHMMNILTQLAHLQPGADTRLNQNIMELLGRTSSDLTMIAITADANYNLAKALGYFAQIGVEARLIYVNPMSFQTKPQVYDSLFDFGSECMSRNIEFQILSKSDVAPIPLPWNKTAEYVTNG